MEPLIVRPEATQDVDDAAQWYEDQREGLGIRFLNEVEQVLKRIEDNPRQFAELEPGVRRALLVRFPYGITFLEDGSSIAVLAVLHLSRHPDTWKRRLQ